NKQSAQGMRSNEDDLPTQHLKLKIGDSFLSSIRLMLEWYRNDSIQIKHIDRRKYEELKTAKNQLNNGKNSKAVPTELKVVPAELPLLTLSVGNKKFIRTDECDVFARFCFQARKVVCQMHIGTLSRRVDIPFNEITSLHVCFDHRGFDILRIEAKFPFKSFSADNPRPGKFPTWKPEYSDGVDFFPKSKLAFLEIKKGLLEKGIAKLLYTNPRLERIANFSRGTSSDQHMYQVHVDGQMQQTSMLALHRLSSNTVFPRGNANYGFNSSYTGLD
ncbi:hypothetical protein EJB05_44888, partial [Eragrostis curvula]